MNFCAKASLLGTLLLSLCSCHALAPSAMPQLPAQATIAAPSGALQSVSDAAIRRILQAAGAEADFWGVAMDTSNSTTPTTGSGTFTHLGWSGTTYRVQYTVPAGQALVLTNAIGGGGSIMYWSPIYRAASALMINGAAFPVNGRIAMMAGENQSLIIGFYEYYQYYYGWAYASGNSLTGYTVPSNLVQNAIVNP